MSSRVDLEPGSLVEEGTNASFRLLEVGGTCINLMPVDRLVLHCNSLPDVSAEGEQIGSAALVLVVGFELLLEVGVRRPFRLLRRGHWFVGAWAEDGIEAAGAFQGCAASRFLLVDPDIECA